MKPDKRALYLGLIERSLGAAARKKFKMLPQSQRLYSETYYEGEAQGQVKGQVQAVLQILATRGLTITDDQRQRIEACADLEVLRRWLDLAVVVTSVEALFG